MDISNAIPIQFWDIGETFNQQPECGLTDVCFCLPRTCDDPITIQFDDIDYDGYVLQILDSESNELIQLPFTQISAGSWQVEFTPSELSPAVCEKVQLRILSDQQSLDLQNEEFDTSDFWYSSGSGSDWISVGGGAATSGFAFGQSPYTTKMLVQDIDLPNQEYTFSIQYTVSDITVGSGRATPRIHFLSGGSVVQTNNMSSQTTGAGTYSASLVVSSIPDGVDAVGFSFSSQSPDEYVLDVNYFRMQEVNYPQIPLKETDCIDLRTGHDCTKLVAYTNATNFSDNSTGAVIDYETSPAPTFYLRIPAQFWKEDNPQTEQSLELSNGEIVTLRQSIQEKRLLEVGYMPAYMHKKLQLALMHDTVTIDGQQWKRRDAYESESIDNYPLKRGNVWLTKYNSVTKNTI